MADYSFLLGSQPVQSPNLLQTAGQAMTLGSMAQQQQLQALNLAKQQDMIKLFSDPQAMQWVQSILNQGQGSAGGPQQSIPQFSFEGHPGGPEFVQSMLGLQKEAAGVQQSLAAAGKDRQQTLDFQLTNIQRLAASGAPSQIIANELRAVGQDPTKFYDPQNPDSFGPNVANGLQDPKVRQDMIKTAALLPIEVAQGKATLAKTQQEVAQMPAELAVKQSQAASAATQAQTARWHYLGGNIAVDTISGNVYQQRPDPNDPTKFISTPVYVNPGASQATPPSAAASGATPAATTQPSQPPQQFNIGGKGQQELVSKNAANAADLEAQIPGIAQGLNTLHSMKTIALSPQGVMSGPVQGSEFFKNVAGVLSQLPGASKDLNDKISNTQAWEAQGGELAFNYLSSMKGVTPRSQAALSMIRTIKPNSLMTPQAQADTIGHLEEVFQDKLSYARSAAAAIKAGGTISNAGIAPRGQPIVNVNPDGSYSIDLTK